MTWTDEPTIPGRYIWTDGHKETIQHLFAGSDGQLRIGHPNGCSLAADQDGWLFGPIQDPEHEFIRLPRVRDVDGRIAKRPSRLQVPQALVRKLVEEGIDVGCSSAIRCALSKSGYSRLIPLEWTFDRNRDGIHADTNKACWDEGGQESASRGDGLLRRVFHRVWAFAAACCLCERPG